MPVLRPTDSLSKPFLVATWVKQETCAELAEQAGLWRAATIGDRYPCIQWRLLLQMVQYLPDDREILNAGNYLGRTTADLAGCHINIEHPLESLSPTHPYMSLRECFLILTFCHFRAALAPPGRGHPHPVFTVRRKHTMESGQVHSGSGYQSGQFGDEIHRFEDDVSRTITIRGFQLIANPTLIGQ